VKAAATPSWGNLDERLPAAWSMIATLLAVSAALLYSIGFIVASAAMASHGVRELEAIRPRYVVIGVTCAAITSGAVLMGTWTIPLASRLWSRPGWRRVPGTLAAIVLLVGTAYGLAFIELQTLWQVRDEALEPLGGAITNIASFGRFNSSVLLVLVLLRRAGWHQSLTRAKLTDTYAIVAVGAVLATTLSYATSVFTIVPIWLGGGSPETVRLEFRAPVELCAPCGEDVRLIDEDSSRLVILLADDTAVEIARTEVRAVLHR